MAPPTLRWGVVGTGWIADMFVTDILAPRSDGPAKHVLAAVGSTSRIQKSQKFIDNHWGGVGPTPRAFGTYQEVYDCPDVDIIYVATPHAQHKWNCLDAIRAGKHILCEKPMALDSEEVESIVAAARAKGVFLMEAVWTRFFPLCIELEKRVKTGDIGRVWRSVIEIGLGQDWDSLPATHRLKTPALGGGALLDLGIYTLTYSSIIMGRGLYGDAHPSPEMISSMDIVNGVDETTTVVLQYKTADGEPQTAVALATTLADSQREFGRIQGKKGVITLYTEFGPSCPSGFRIRWEDGSEQDFPVKHPEGTIGFIHEADAVAKDIFAGRTENERMPLAETLRMMRLMDRVRAQNGLVYPKNNR